METEPSRSRHRSETPLHSTPNADYNIAHLLPAEVDTQTVRDINALLTQLSGTLTNRSVDEIRNSANLNRLFVARLSDSNSVIGMACLVPMHVPQGLRLWVETVVVHEDYRRRGIGRDIIEAILDEAADMGAEHVSLTCNNSRLDAQAFYREAGFDQVATAVFRRNATRRSSRLH